MHKTLIIAAFFSPLSAFATTLIIGDSHVVGPFGENLHKYFYEEAQENVRTVGLAGGTATSFTSPSENQRTLGYGFADRKNDKAKKVSGGTKATAPEFGRLLAEERPQRVVVELGDNFADYKSPNAHSNAAVVAQVKRIKDQLKRSEFHGTCYWVTPTWTDKSGSRPYMKTNERLVEVIALIKKEAEPQCTVIDSAEGIGLSKGDIATTADGLHFDEKNGKKWARAVAQQIEKVEKKKTSANKVPSGTR